VVQPFLKQVADKPEVQEAVTDWRLWVVAGISILGFGLSLYNTWRNQVNSDEARENRNEIQRLEREQKARAIRLEEFRSSVRDPIRSASSDLPPIIRRLNAVAQTRTAIDESSQQLEELEAEARSVIGQVIDTLQDANLSRFADGEDWAEGVYEFEDSVAEAFNMALDTTSAQAKRLAAVERAGELLSNLRSMIHGRVDERLDHYAEMSREGPANH